MKPISYANIGAAIEHVRPIGDFVLVKHLPEDRGRSLIIKPQVKEGKRVEPPRRGLVIAAGPGDRGPAGERHPMHVERGDEVLYWRAPANNISIDGEEYVFLHEEQHILAVLER